MRWPSAILALVLIGCTAPVGAPVPSGSSTTGTAAGPHATSTTVAPSTTRTPDPSIPASPSPTSMASPGSPSLTHHPESTHVAEPTPLADPDELVVRVTTCDDVCVVMPGTTVLADGRVIWYALLPSESDEPRYVSRMFERRLMPSGLRSVREALAATDLLTTDASYEPEKTSDADTGHGFAWYRFRRVVDGRPIAVLTLDPDVFDADNEQQPGTWAIPEEMRTLAPLARGLLDPPSWFMHADWAALAQPFDPKAYFLRVDADRSGHVPDSLVDVRDVAWPFAGDLMSIGEPVVVDGRSVEGARCLPMTVEQMRAVVSAEVAAGIDARSLEAPWDRRTYAWVDGPGTVGVTTRIRLPDQPTSCEDGGTW